MSAERRNFLDRLEPVIYWDATYAIAFIDENERFHAECDVFFQHLIDASALSVLSDMVFNEVAFHRIKAALLTEGNRIGQHWMSVKRNQPNFISTVMLDVETKRRELEEATLKLLLTDHVTNRAFQLMRSYSILPTDAYHIAIALEAGINVFVSLDEDFLRVDGIIVYTCLP